MSTVLGCTQVDQVVGTGLSAEETLRRQVWEILAGLGPQAHHPERRTVQRFPYPNLLYLTPVAGDGITPWNFGTQFAFERFAFCRGIVFQGKLGYQIVRMHMPLPVERVGQPFCRGVTE